MKDWIIVIVVMIIIAVGAFVTGLIQGQENSYHKGYNDCVEKYTQILINSTAKCYDMIGNITNQFEKSLDNLSLGYTEWFGCLMEK